MKYIYKALNSYYLLKVHKNLLILSNMLLILFNKGALKFVKLRYFNELSFGNILYKLIKEEPSKYDKSIDSN